jgi:hypothetical protein
LDDPWSKVRDLVFPLNEHLFINKF